MLFELWYGDAKSAQAMHDAGRIRQFMAGQILEHAADAHEVGEIRAVLDRAGTPTGPYDTLVAAQARRGGATLVMAKPREFARMASLISRDWFAA